MAAEFVTVKAKAGEVARIIENLQETVDGEDVATTLMACLGLSMILQRPQITKDDLVKAIDDVSKWVAFYLENLDGIPPERIN